MTGKFALNALISRLLYECIDPGDQNTSCQDVRKMSSETLYAVMATLLEFVNGKPAQSK